MGAYLSEPNTNKESSDSSSDRLSYGASSMQGWRITQEDDHNACISLDLNTALFAVYDGHGGSEVAKYCAKYLPEKLKELDEYKLKDFEEALKKLFLVIDEQLTSEEAKKELRQLAGPSNELDVLENVNENDEEEEEEEEEDQGEEENVINKNNGIKENNDEDDVENLYDEATMPLHEVLKRYAKTRNRVRKALDKKRAKLGLPPKKEGEKKDDEKEEEKEEEKPKENGSGTNEKDEDTESDDDYEEGDDLDESEEEGSDEDDDSNGEEIDEEDEGDDDDEDADFEGMMGGDGEPGSDSGCTAVVSLLVEKKLFVANAGDSRCVICRGGKAIDMSIDHKPEDEIERERIEKAGGKITSDGRVNGGLNLSRAIGDHVYKANKELKLEEQMISAMPDVKSIDLEDDDEFMVLACDGIWNFMSSQDVIDFIKERLNVYPKLSQICEELFMHCLAPNTNGDGTGCDNMTCIIVTFKPYKVENGHSLSATTINGKRSLDDDSQENTNDESNSKKLKTVE